MYLKQVLSKFGKEILIHYDARILFIPVGHARGKETNVVAMATRHGTKNGHMTFLIEETRPVTLVCAVKLY